MVDLTVRPGEHQRGATVVVPSDDVGRTTIGAADLDDLAGASTLTDVITLDDEFVTDVGMHHGHLLRLIVRAAVHRSTGAKVTEAGLI